VCVAFYLRANLRYKVTARSTLTSAVDYFFIQLKLPFPILLCDLSNPPNMTEFSVFGLELSLWFSNILKYCLPKEFKSSYTV
jgi:hypothetical protein